MNKRNKTSIFSLIIAFVLLVASAVIPFTSKAEEKVYAEEIDKSIYAFVSTQNSKAVNGKIYVDFGLTLDYCIKNKEDEVINEDGVINILDATTMVDKGIQPFDSARIYFRTRNMSAISEEGDYEAIDQVFTVTSSNPYASVAVQVNKKGLQIGSHARQFIVEIYKVEITGLKDGYTFNEPNTTSEISSMTLSSGAELTIGEVERSLIDGKLRFLDFTYYNQDIWEITLRPVETNTSFNDIKVNLANIGGNWYNKVKFLSDNDMLKLGIRVYGAAHEEYNSWYTDNSFVGIQIFGGDSSGVGAPNLEGVPASNVFSNSSAVELARWFAKFQSDESEDMRLTEAFSGEFDGVTVGTSFNKNVLVANDIEPDVSGEGGPYDAFVGDMSKDRNNVFLIDDLNAVLKGSTTISTRFWHYRSSKEKFFNGGIQFVPTNYRAHVKNATFGQIYKDKNGNYKLGVSLRFSEPIQFKDKTTTPRLDGYINGLASNVLTFNYVSGESTDTLYFETDVSAYKMNITKLSLKSAYGFNEVYDFAPQGGTYGTGGNNHSLTVMHKERSNEVNGWIDNIQEKTYICSYDLREPDISINSNVTQTVKTSHTVTIKTDKINEKGYFYYAWTTDDQTEPKTLIREPISTLGYQIISSPANVSGTRYLYAYAVSDLDKRSEAKWFGPFNFDNDAPTIDVKLLENSYKQKNFEITITNKTPTINYFDKFAELKKTLKLYVTSDPKGTNLIKEFDIKVPDDMLKNEAVTVTRELKASELDFVLNSDKEYGEYYIFFSISDALGNQGKTEPISYYFDVRDIFDVSLTKNDFEMDEFAPGKLSIDENYHTIDLSKLGGPKSIVFEATVSSVIVNEFKNVKTNVSVTSYDVQINSSNGQVELIILQKLTPGLYQLILQDEASDKKSLPIYFYVTNGKVNGVYQEETGGYLALSNNVVFTNKVFQIPTTIPYYYMTDTGTVVTQSYSDGNRPTLFSSAYVARSYILYREYLDLHAVILTSTLAEDLNRGGISSHHKAEGVSQLAEEGQVWIRYKEVNWKPDTTTSDWVYYYYGDDSSSLPINIDALSGELELAINTVANMICSFGEDINLVTQEYLDKYGAPMIKPEQMRLQAETSATSMTGTTFYNPVEYLGDTGMNVSLSSDYINAPLATNAILQLNENRRYYYKTDGGEYRSLTNSGNKTLGEYFNATGKFTILEIDELGVREYYVYIDKSAPTLNITWTTTGDDPTKEYKTFTKNDEGQTISGSNFCIESITDDDTLSFVAIYRYTNQGEGDLLNVYRKSDFDAGNLIRLEDGKYHVQVSDRSGNSYIFVLQVKSTPLTLTVKEVNNSYIRVGLNRDESEVRYQVYLDGRLLTTNYNDNKFTDSGEYRFVVEDIYGNVEEQIVIFERDLPVVNWRYQIADGTYVAYDFDVESRTIKINKDDELNYTISTSTYLRFVLLDGCTFEILSGDPNPNKNITSGWVTLNNKVPFTMKVYYESFPETYVMYTCIVDDSVPEINVSYEQEYYQVFEIDEIQQKLASGELVLGDNLFMPTNIGFSLIEDKSTTLYVTNGQTVESKYFKVQASDESGIKEVQVYCDDKLILTKTSDFSNIYLSRRGSYKIVATDKLGNTSTFTFENNYKEIVEYFVDGKSNSTDISPNDFVNKEYTKVEYGKSQAEIKIVSSAEVHYIITGEDGKTYYFAFVVEDGLIYTYQYLINVVQVEKLDQTTGEKVKVNEIESVSTRGTKELSSGIIAEVKEIGVAIYLSKHSDGSITLITRSTDTEKKCYTVETRISSLENQKVIPYYFKTEISTISSTIEFVDKNDNLINSTSTIKVNEGFAIKNNFAEEIQIVQVAYSQTGNYTTYTTVYDGSYNKIIFDKEGMYHVKVVNRYGIQTDYYVIISRQFVMSATVEYIDGTTSEFSTNYTKVNDDFYSNKGVEFVVYATNIKVSFDNLEKISVVSTEQGYTVIYVNISGKLEVEDEYGNKLVKNIFIKASTLTINENMLKNFNEKALRRDENYTNTKVIINENAISENNVAYIGMIYGDKKITIYDNVSEIKTVFDNTQCIGAFGDGEYILIFKDVYGNKLEKIVHYSGTSTLTILRKTVNGVGSELYSLEDMAKYGVWTNDSVTFNVTATKYVLTVNGKNNVKSISYDTKTQNEYSVYYLDEYGYEYSFTVYLHRENVTIQPDESMTVSQLSDVLVTKNSVKIIFTQDALCSYTLNNEAEKPYNAGDLLYKDGIYHFRVVDKAGNVSTYTIKKDSAVEYRLEGSGASEILINGSVTNSNTVKFYAENSDSAYIKKVFHNNEFIEYDQDIFTERGKWELIVADDVGNESYFRFYILYGKLDGFIYNTPYDYKINSVIWEMEDSSVSATETIMNDGLRLEAVENGRYTVTMEHLVTGDVQTFAFTIDKTPPSVELVGCQVNEKTINNVTLKGCAVGDTIYVYKDKELVKTVRIESGYMDPPTIDEAGKYKIIVQNEAGVQTELSFERKYVPNVAGSVLVIILSLAVVAGLFIGLIWRNHSKTDD